MTRTEESRASAAPITVTFVPINGAQHVYTPIADGPTWTTAEPTQQVDAAWWAEHGATVRKSAPLYTRFRVSTEAEE